MATNKQIEREWNEFWKPILYKDGALDIEQLKRELYDYSFILEEVPVVYDAITGGKISDPNSYAEDVLANVVNMKF